MRKMLNVLMAAIVFACLAVGAGPAHAVLQALGPVSPATGYPLWYQDTNNLTLGLCLDQNGFCVIDPLPNPLPANRANINSTNFPVESFYYMADTSGTSAGGTINLVLYEAAVEAGFIGAVVDGGQAAFTRIRIRADVTVPGTYTVTHPYGVKSFTVTTIGAGNEINDTVDVPGLVILPFDQNHPSLAGTPALPQAVGPFLTRADGTLVTDPITGNKYIGFPGAPVAVTGSPFGTNFVQITGPSADIFLSNTFSLMGKPLGLVITPPAAGTDYGFWKINNTSPARTFTVENLSQNAVALRISSIVTGSNPVITPSPDIIINDGTCAAPVAAGGTCAFTVAFSPADNGAKSATITVAEDADPATVPPVQTTITGHGDSIAPTVTFNGGNPQVTNLTNPTISGTINDNVGGAGEQSVQISVNGVPQGTASVNTLTHTWGPRQITLTNVTPPNDENIIEITGTDLAFQTGDPVNGPPTGNTSTPVSFSIIVDNTAPAVTINVTSPTNTNTQTISGTAIDANGISSVSVEVNGVLQGLATVVGDNWTFEVTNLLPVTPNSITATATDLAGNSGSATASITFIPPNDGDADLNTIVNIADALLTLRAAVQLVELTPEQQSHADVNLDGVVNVTDALLILRKSVGLPVDF